MICFTYLESPVQPLLLASDGQSLTGLVMVESRYPPVMDGGWQRDDDARPFAEARRQLQSYFDGQLTAFDLPLAMRGTDFQRRVWQELMRIPYGTTISYGEMAGRVGKLNGARAVGAANGRNPISIIVPCHRLVGSTGKLVDYGGGLERKRWLLTHEAKDRPNQSYARILGENLQGRNQSVR
jgi:methylated-DNA-[protein]-cysteine S-methyltransferase